MPTEQPVDTAKVSEGNSELLIIDGKIVHPLLDPYTSREVGE